MWISIPPVVAVLVGAGRTAAELTDDSLGRALDKLARTHPAGVFSAVATQAYLHEGITLDGGHFDTTSRSVTGAYDQHGAAPVQPPFGHSKDARPNLKQILLTLFVNHDGVPLLGTVESGNRSHKMLNAEMVDRLARQRIAFVSRCAETFGIVAELTQEAWAAGRTAPSGSAAPRPAIGPRSTLGRLTDAATDSWFIAPRPWISGARGLWIGKSAGREPPWTRRRPCTANGSRVPSMLRRRSRGGAPHGKTPGV
ncbi:MAG: hypothetical protein M0Z36_04480 [Thermaerobacter sp.]|nr:hypothetical protein [Thermaerobacter sp.]